VQNGAETVDLEPTQHIQLTNCVRLGPSHFVDCGVPCPSPKREHTAGVVHRSDVTSDTVRSLIRSAFRRGNGWQVGSQRMVVHIRPSIRVSQSVRWTAMVLCSIQRCHRGILLNSIFDHYCVNHSGLNHRALCSSSSNLLCRHGDENERLCP